METRNQTPGKSKILSMPSWPAIQNHMNQNKNKEIIKSLRQHSHPVSAAEDLDPLMEAIGDARIVLLGEASHGTHEFYLWRSLISQRLIQEKGFNFLAVEGDWPDCYRLNRYIKGYQTDQRKASEVLHNFDRWPSWMWANWEIAALADWLKSYNQGQAANRRVGFYGLDVYSLWESMEAMIHYLEKEDRAAAEELPFAAPARVNTGRIRRSITVRDLSTENRLGASGNIGSNERYMTIGN